MSKEEQGRTGYYRWVFRLYGGYLIGGVILVVILLASITDTNAGYPALFFGSVLLVIAVPVCVLGAVLAAVSLTKREAYRSTMIGALVVSCLIVWSFHGLALRFAEALVQALRR